MDKSVNIVTREALEGDRALIFSTWLKGLYFGNAYFGNMRESLFMPRYQKVIEQLLIASEVKVACLEDDPDIVIGYAVWTGDRLHYVYVKSAWRRLGVAKSLVPATIKYVSHLTDLGSKLRNKYSLEYDPFL